MSERHSPFSQQPILTWTLLSINIALFVLPWLADMLAGTTIQAALLDLGAKDNLLIARGGQYYRFLSAMFLHASVTHILFNGFALYSLGREVERAYGHGRFAAVYFIAGLGGGVASYLTNPSPSVGASGAIFGLIGALGAVYVVSRDVFGSAGRQMLGSLMFTILINLGLGLTTPLIDNAAHIGGLIVGAIVGWGLAPRLSFDQLHTPPQLRRDFLAIGWPIAAVVLLGLVGIALTLTPPL